MKRKFVVGLMVAASVLLAGGVVLAAPKGDGSNTLHSPKSPAANVAAPVDLGDMVSTAVTPAGSTAQTSTAVAPKSAVVRGWVVAVNGNAIRIDLNRAGAAARDVNVQTTLSTTFYVQGVANPTISDVKVDDNVAVLVARPIVNRTQPLAEAVAVLPAPSQQIVSGKVSNLSSDSFTLTNARGISLGTVSVGSSTKVIVPGQPGVGVDALKNGDSVAVYGRPAGRAALDAQLIVVRPLNKTNTFGGLVVSVSDSTIVMWTPAGEQLTVDASNAVFFAPNIPNAGLSNMRVGQTVYVIGSRSGNDVTAQLVTNAPLAQIQAARAKTQPKPKPSGRVGDNDADDGPSA